MGTLAILAERMILEDESRPKWQHGESADSELQAARRGVKERLLAAENPFLTRPYVDVEGIRAFLSILDECITGLNVTAGLHGILALTVRHSLLLAGLPSLLLYRSGNASACFDWLLSQWCLYALTFGALPESIQGANPRMTEVRLAADAADTEIIGLYNAALTDMLVQSGERAHARQVLARLKTSLGLEYEELGQMFHVSAWTARSWMTAQDEIPHQAMAGIIGAEVALGRLLQIFRPERLPIVIRRPADGFLGETALQWILNGRIAEVAGHYRNTFRYQA